MAPLTENLCDAGDLIQEDRDPNELVKSCNEWLEKTSLEESSRSFVNELIQRVKEKRAEQTQEQICDRSVSLWVRKVKLADDSDKWEMRVQEQIFFYALWLYINMPGELLGQYRKFEGFLSKKDGEVTLLV